MNRCHRTFVRRRTAQDWLNLIALSILAAISIGAGCMGLMFTNSDPHIPLAVLCLILPCIVSPAVSLPIAHAGLTTLFKPKRIVVNSWGWQVYYAFGRRVDIKREGRSLRAGALKERKSRVPAKLAALYLCLSVAGLFFLAVQQWGDPYPDTMYLQSFYEGPISTPASALPVELDKIPTWYPLRTTPSENDYIWTSWAMEGTVTGQIVPGSANLVWNRNRQYACDWQANYQSLLVPPRPSNRNRIWMPAGFLTKLGTY